MSNLDEVYQYLNRATRYDRYIVSLCPFHSDSRPSFFVYEDRFRCSACEKSGTTEWLIKTLRTKGGGIVQVDTGHFFRNPWNTWLRTDSLEKTCINAHRFAIDKNRTSYMRERGLNEQTISKCKLGWKDNWITFPIFDQNNHVIGATARAGKDKDVEAKYVNPKGQDPNILYVPSWELVNSKQLVFLTFGIIDSLLIFQMGYPSFSTTTGKRLDPEALSDIRKKIYIFPDDGEVINAVYLSAQLGWRGEVIRCDYPSGCKDPANLHNHHRNLLENILNEQSDRCNVGRSK